MKTIIRSLLILGLLAGSTTGYALTPEESVKEISDNLNTLNPVTWTATNQKYHIVVFIDNQCTYCSDVVKNIKKYTDAGLTMSFLTVAPDSIHDEVINDMARVWCASDAQASLKSAMEGFLPDNASTPECIRTVERQSALAKRLGVEVTPTMIVMQAVPVVLLGNGKPGEILEKLR